MTPSMLLFDGDHYSAGQWYLICLVILVAIQSIPRLWRSLRHLLCRQRKTVDDGQQATTHNPILVFFHRLTYFHLPFYPYYPTRLIIFLVLYILISVLFATGSITLEKDVGYPRYGYMALANLCAATIFALRNSPAYYLLALPFERTIEFHKWFGIGAMVFAWVHGGLYLRQWEAQDVTALMFNMRSRLAFGAAVAALVAFVVLAAQRPIRRRMWELFWAIHIFGFLAIFVLVNFHTTKGFEFTLPPLLLWGLDRVIRFTRGWLRPAVAETSDCNGQVTRLVVHQNPLWGRAYQAGQYVFLNVPRAGMIEWHPASIVSGAPLKNDLEGADGAFPPTQNQYTLVLRNVGSFTRRLTQVGASQEKLKVRIDGPYGKWDLVAKNYNLIVLVAGGIGATPILSVLLTVLRKSSKTGFNRKVEFIWAVQTENQIMWFADELAQASALGARIRIFVTQTSETTSSTAMVTHTEDGVKMFAGCEILYFRPHIEDVCQDIKNNFPGIETAVGVCGPPGMVRSTRDAVRKCSDVRSLWHLHAEAFDL
ncbi:uncharacterized protein SPPG_07217 [Spizellomyces punctatus DAOM BR117]|uniref:FAD-binding FR-type domain-containing protein n=1 Tax=Spizellomyces punctatus (strain DAOM BR117) TaxID=645134 RepID=A0A0L0H9F9_SPIPD|nr:uncharacterized protein SPPG_07217 [Spizellomyces punctatus DAOM BR117]KNC97288.1 hypothetical protein SPPG_07217 [Spizellomyces punctatus DAOM BR117]|eukprot:XP_016605328.1 hypothetical protein SPPG_07217 [Spizellomyces punctatus DAOM BR117]